VSELERVTEFNPRQRAFRTEPFGKSRCFLTRSAEVAGDAVNADEQPPCLVILGMLAQALGEQVLGIFVAASVDEEDRLSMELGLAGSTGRERKRAGEHEDDARCHEPHATKTAPPGCRVRGWYKRRMRASEVRRITVVGAGQMGAGIAQVAAAQGIEVSLGDVTLEHATRGKQGIGKQLGRLVDKGKITREAVDALLARITPSVAGESYHSADVAIEAATENRELKAKLVREMDAALPPGALLLTNTSSISVTWLAGLTKRPELVAGMHFMNPVPLMKLVEVVRGLATSAETLRTVAELAERLEKTVITSDDRPGFIVNRMVVPLLNEACFALEEGIGSAEAIDTGARLGLNHPLGPLELADLVGLDTVLAICEVLHRDFGDDKYRPSATLRNLVAAGWLGKKTGRGFYAYDAQGQKLGPSLERWGKP
jgi:3-hydroxybutyryl-CoA dehydrogenase